MPKNPEKDAPDFAKLAQIHQASFITPRPWAAPEISDFLTAKHAFLLERAPYGFLLGTAIAGEAEVITLAVAPEARRQGIAASLLAEFIATARMKSCDTAFLEVAADNHAAIALYETHGFHVCGKRRGYYHLPQGDAIDAILMRRDIAPEGAAAQEGSPA